jgi:hypothetical protein
VSTPISCLFADHQGFTDIFIVQDSNPTPWLNPPATKNPLGIGTRGSKDPIARLPDPSSPMRVVMKGLLWLESCGKGGLKSVSKEGVSVKRRWAFCKGGEDVGLS